MIKVTSLLLKQVCFVLSLFLSLPPSLNSFLSATLPCAHSPHIVYSGHPGLWLDESFYHGASYKCSTFNNECLASSEEFICSGVEAWGFL